MIHSLSLSEYDVYHFRIKVSWSLWDKNIKNSEYFMILVPQIIIAKEVLISYHFKAQISNLKSIDVSKWKEAFVIKKQFRWEAIGVRRISRCCDDIVFFMTIQKIAPKFPKGKINQKGYGNLPFYSIFKFIHDFLFNFIYKTRKLY